MAPNMAAESLRNIFYATAVCPGLRAAVQRQPDGQQQVVRLCARCLVLPEAELEMAMQDNRRRNLLACMAQLLATDCFAAGIQQHEAAGGGVSFLLVAGALAARAHLGLAPEASVTQATQALLALPCLTLHAQRGHTMLRQQGLPEAHMAALLQQLGGPGGLPLLCQLAGEVAAASGSAAAGSTAARADSNSFGAQCWGTVLVRPWTSALSSWMQYCVALAHHDLSSVLCSSDTYAAACRAGEALLRLAPLLPCQPGQEPAPGSSGGWRSLGAVGAAAGGAHAFLRAGLPCDHQGAAGVLGLTMTLPKLVATLLSLPGAEISPETALAIFQAHVTACRHTHAMAPHLHPCSTEAAGSSERGGRGVSGAAAGAPAAGGGAGGSAPAEAGMNEPIVFEKSAATIGRCLCECTMQTYAYISGLLRELPPNEQGPFARCASPCDVNTTAAHSSAVASLLIGP